MIGLWGMGGIGKTTIAETIYKKLSINYEGCCFVGNVREKFVKHEVKSIAEDLFSKLLGEKVDIETPRVESTSFIVKRLQQKKVLIVLDDVNSSRQLDELVGEHSWFGIGSRIVVTTRDKQAISKRADGIYEVKERKFDEARQIFCARAFQGNELPVDYMALCDRVLDYAKGVPLALKVLGSLLYGKSKNEWESALNKLKKIPNIDIQKVLRLSYDSLDHGDKEIFLDIAHFFKICRVDFVKQTLNSCGFHADIGIRTLVDKSLITILSEDFISMHDLIQEMGLDVVRQECIKKPERRSRLENHEEIQHELPNLKELWFELCKSLIELPDLSKAQNLERICLHDCSSLVHLPSSIEYLQKLNYLGLMWCTKLRSIQRIHLRSHSDLDLDGCNSLEEVSFSSKISEIPASIKNISNLRSLDVRHCERLESLPQLPSSLRQLDASRCTQLETVYPFSLRKIRPD
ncbi:putative disease resistance protein (TIR-NBS-LRR class) [Quillaja saponaria]|uniref:Disease resistance protein (TIR-NBS-LRR class) n=1 Tax=Quillaja saponaria TaxID=32244 RepID=A0AAD7PPK5_QUISA|nr:putative disease resistance protein (TIR-NBS-LRR class) [Quillaja saponaria]